MTENIVYNPKEHASNQKNVATKKPGENSKTAKTTKPIKAKKSKGPADAGAHEKDGFDVNTDEPVTQFKAKVNKYGFLHVPKKALPSLPFKIEQPLEARIDGNQLIIAVTTEKQTK
jgi:hypothetical protein